MMTDDTQGGVKKWIVLDDVICERPLNNNNIYSRLTTNGLAFARTALSKTNRNS